MKCLSYATENRPRLLRQLLDYMGDYYQPLLDSRLNALTSALVNRSEKCVSMLLEHVQSQEIKDQLIATKRVETNALIGCVWAKSPALLDQVVKNHSDIETLLGASFRYCLKYSEVTSARDLLNLSDNKSAILNEKDDNNYNVLMFAVQRKTDEFLKFVVDKLDDDHNRPRAIHVDRDENSSRESSYSQNHLTPWRSTSKDYRSDDEDDLKTLPMYDDEDKIADHKIHPMYFETTHTKGNIFHHLLRYPEGALSQLEVLEGVFNKEQIQRLLQTPDQDGRLPLHCISTSIDPEVLQWILDKQFDGETLVKFNMIAARNKFGKSNWSTLGATKPLQVMMLHSSSPGFEYELNTLND